MKKTVKIFKDGLITQNPIFVQILGTCPTLAVSTTLINGIGMGLSVTAVLVFSNLVISMLRKVIDKRIRIASYIIIIAGFVSIVDMLLSAYLPSLAASLGVFIPLITVNCIILARAEAFAGKNPVLPSFFDGIAMGLGFTLSISLVSLVREILGTGALFGRNIVFIPPTMFFSLAPGGLLVLGILMAFFKWIGMKSAEAKARKRISATSEVRANG